MTQRILRLTAMDAKGVTLADPSNIQTTLRVERSESKRVVGIENVTVNRARFVSLKPKRTILEGTTNVVASTPKATLELSCDQYTRAEMKQLLSDLFRNSMAAIDDGLLEGFIPDQDVQFVIEAPLVSLA